MIKDIYDKFLKTNGIATDTRKDIHKKMFFCLSGDNFDGNEFAQAAHDNGATYIVIDNPKFAHIPNTILVKNSLETLQQLANFHRNHLKTPIISLTGSNGKTTTKELIFSVLNQSFKVTKTEGNLNNHIGVPLTLLSITPQTDIAIVEMGANHPKEIETLCLIAEPDYGYITNFGKAHLEGFLSLEGVIKAKTELYDYLKKQQKTIFLNQDNAVQVEKLQNYSKKYTFSLQNHTQANVKIELKNSQPFLEFLVNETNIKTHLVGLYNADNVAVAVCIARYFKLSEEAIKRGIESYVPANNRSQIIDYQTNKILLDAYNANPSSMLAAVDNFVALKSSKKILILGDMKELGAESESEHQALVDYIAQFSWEAVLLVGENFLKTKTNFLKFENAEVVKNYLKNQNYQHSFWLIKGSRSMKMEQIIQ